MLKSKVLLPSDGSLTATKAAAYAARLMKINPDIKLDILVVLPEKEGLAETKNKTKDMFETIDGAIEAKGKDILERTIQVFTREGQNVQGYIEKGAPAAVIIEFSRMGNYEHIIMGSRGVSELRGTAIGSVSHQVIHQANCRVTLVK
ncbi:MAG: universal stress protein [Desulfotomaculaceae bacterium]|nr:universal stress protein [Desulfotomaculaceae bacterium]